MLCIYTLIYTIVAAVVVVVAVAAAAAAGAVVVVVVVVVVVSTCFNGIFFNPDFSKLMKYYDVADSFSNIFFCMNQVVFRAWPKFFGTTKIKHT